MEILQRSFSLKPTRFLVFSFTISSSCIFLFIFSLLVFQHTPSSLLPHVSNFQINTTTTSVGFGRNVTVSIVKYPSLRDTTHLTRLDNSTWGTLDLVGKKQLLRNISEVEDGSTKFGNFSKRVEVLTSEKIEGKKSSECDVSHGRWVYDESYPLYTNRFCQLIDEGFSCEANGRPDRDYMKWRWQPYHCDLPRFNATKMLEMIRGKRLVFVGDSMNRNQWESMLCLLRSAIKDPKRVYETHGRRITKEKGNYSFKFLDYKCTVEYYVTHFLVHEGKARVKQKRVQTLRIDAIDRSSSRWKGADILVFNTAHWWTHYKTKSGVNYYQEGDQVHPYLDASTAFRRALTTWASWVDKHIPPGKTKVFFRSSAPSHFRGGQWNSGGHCKDGLKPLNDTLNAYYPEKNLIAEEVIKEMSTAVILLNITRLSGYRIDGHPSIYGKKPGKPSLYTVQDCSHWCLPGVPDTWNELLYFYLQSGRKDQSKM
ncbi:hypothetical protein IFM89_008023 [Coptis chinensis]|uniref:Trichome birefringence-like N-terminal domain-containing protein n=1 Tax=Coptis chinensis TaxID=261450 RepID=A0A835HTW3_9MAGN|nr:hypothetical protein IFM89_008023 [Coptis chinensis]